MQRVDAIVPLYNESVESVLVTVNGLNLQTYPIRCIYLVDDGSTQPPDFDPIVRCSRISVKVLRLAVNVGISEARNQAARLSDADFFVFVNCQVELSPEWTEKLVSFGINRPEAGALCGRVSWAQDSLVSKWRTRFFGNKETWVDQTHEITWAVGYALLVRAVSFWKVGGWNEHLKRATEDGDLSRRLRQADFKIYQVEGALGFCHEEWTLRVLTKKIIRNLGWSLDPDFSGDVFLRPVRLYAAVIDFLKASAIRTGRNIFKRRFTFLIIDAAVTIYGLYLIVGVGIRRGRRARRYEGEGSSQEEGSAP